MKLFIPYLALVFGSVIIGQNAAYAHGSYRPSGQPSPSDTAVRPAGKMPDISKYKTYIDETLQKHIQENLF